MDKMTELKPCPFCGGEAEVCSTGTYGIKFFYRINCKRYCCIQVEFYSNKEDAAEAWNQRVNDGSD